MNNDTSALIGQYCIIYLHMGLIALVASRLSLMKYHIDVIIVRLFFGDLKPLSWLAQNLKYVWYMGFLTCESIKILGLINQIRFHTYNQREPDAWVTGTLGPIFIALILYDFFIKEDLYQHAYTLTRKVNDLIRKITIIERIKNLRNKIF